MAAAAPVVPGSGRLSRTRPPRVGLRGAGAVMAAAAEGPSCLYVGPIETASQEKLEALYHQVPQLGLVSRFTNRMREKLFLFYVFSCPCTTFSPPVSCSRVVGLAICLH